jgi:hypothetical protein
VILIVTSGCMLSEVSIPYIPFIDVHNTTMGITLCNYSGMR